MGKIIFSLTLLLFLAMSLLSGCEKTEGNRLEDSRQEVRVAETKFLEEWETFKRESEQTIASNEKLIDAFRNKIETSGPVYKAMYNREAVALDLRNRNLMIRLTDYEDGGQSNLREFRILFNERLYDVEKTMKDLFANID
jgi:hypothetical protein